MIDLSGKVVAVTGGGTGIGAGIARVLAEAGCRVTVGGRRSDPLEALATSITCQHPLRTHAIDVADAGSIEAFFANVRQNVGEVDILVNSAGINIRNRTMAEMDPDDWERVLKSTPAERIAACTKYCLQCESDRTG